jgi:hypothetical protein
LRLGAGHVGRDVAEDPMMVELVASLHVIQTAAARQWGLRLPCLLRPRRTKPPNRHLCLCIAAGWLRILWRTPQTSAKRRVSSTSSSYNFSSHLLCHRLGFASPRTQIEVGLGLGRAGAARPARASCRFGSCPLGMGFFLFLTLFKNYF